MFDPANVMLVFFGSTTLFAILFVVMLVKYENLKIKSVMERRKLQSEQMELLCELENLKRKG